MWMKFCLFVHSWFSDKFCFLDLNIWANELLTFASYRSKNMNEMLVTMLVNTYTTSIRFVLDRICCTLFRKIPLKISTFDLSDASASECAPNARFGFMNLLFPWPKCTRMSPPLSMLCNNLRSNFVLTVAVIATFSIISQKSLLFVMIAFDQD